MKCDLFNKFLLVFLLSSFAFPVSSARNMAVTVEGATSYLIPMSGGGFGGGARFEYLFSPFVSFVTPIKYREFSLSAFANTSNFEIITGGVGGKFYFSQLFWPQENLKGFFVEAGIDIGFAHETGRYPQEVDNKGWAFALVGKTGYSHVFDFGLFIEGSLGLSGRGFTPPIVQPLVSVFPIPELALNLGFAF